MPNKNRRYRNAVYTLYTALFLLLLAGFGGSIMYLTGFDPAVGWTVTLFIALLLLLASLLVRTLKREAFAIADSLNEIVAGAISGQPPRTGYTEGAVSALEQKLLRYVELASAQEYKAQAEKDNIKTLISDISHQTKTPLSNIVLYSGLLEEAASLDGEARSYMLQIKEQSAKLDWLISSLISMSRLETGIITIQTELAPVKETITRAVSPIFTRAEQRNIQIRINCNPEIRARHDAKWTAEALYNLLDNAVKYGGDEKDITIAVQANEMFTRIDVKDEGIGIEESEWNLIFKRFYRSPKTAAYEGVGIGLYLTREIVAAQGGYIKVTSVPGEGAVFSVFLTAL